MEVALTRYQDERARLDEAERSMSMRTQELSRMGHSLEQHIAQSSAAQGVGNDLATRVATLVDAVTEVVIAVQARRAAGRDTVNQGARAVAPGVEIVDEMATLVDAMTVVVNVVRTRLIPTLKPSAASGRGDRATLPKAV